MSEANEGRPAPPRGAEHTRPGCWAVLGAVAAPVLVMLTFLALLGGIHPSDRERDRTLVAVAAVVVLLHAPLLVWIARAARSTASRRAALLTSLAVLGSLLLSAMVLGFVHGISHERPDPDDARDVSPPAGEPK